MKKGFKVEDILKIINKKKYKYTRKQLVSGLKLLDGDYDFIIKDLLELKK